jgi:ribosomal protein L24
MERIKKGDTVEVLAGGDAADSRRDGKKLRGTVHRVIPGYTIDRYRREWDGSEQGPGGGAGQFDHQTNAALVTCARRSAASSARPPIHISNVMLVCRLVGRRGLIPRSDGGVMVRYCKRQTRQ